MTRADLSRDSSTLTVRVPFAVRKRGGRKLVVVPDGAAWTEPRPRVDSAMVKALARAYRWQRKLESGEYSSITELAEAEKVNRSYVCRVLRLTLLAPDIVEAVLDGRQPLDLTLPIAMKTFTLDWLEQRPSFLPV